MRQKLEVKIAAIYFIIIGVIIGSYFIAFKTIYVNHELKVMGEESVKTLHTMKTATLAIIENADNYSKILLADDDIQEVLKTGDIYSNLPGQFKVAKRIYGLLQFAKDISGVYLIDQKDQIYSVGAREDLVGRLENKGHIPWYQDTVKKNGNYLLSLDRQGITRKLTGKQVSLIRVYKDLKDFQNIGIISVNIDIMAFQGTYREILKEDKEQIIFLDNQNRIICQNGLNLLNGKQREEFLSRLCASKEGTLKDTLKVEKKKYLVTGVVIPSEGWKIIRLQPLDIKQESLGVLTTNILLVLLSAVLILWGTILVANLITVPIQHLLISMKSAEKGEFIKVEYKPFFDEFRYLFEGYNQLLDKISLLLRQTVEKQKMIRKVELNEMQEQMKPHFLYNTLDSIQALAMLGELDKVCEIVEALGDFYRKSVSKGKEMLSINEELIIVDDYIKIMKIRFANLFEETFDIQEECKAYLIPKLTLQPLVENAIHHGLRERAENGTLHISVKVKEEWVHIRVADNGSGIPEDVVEELRANIGSYKGKSFGLRGTIERMCIIYGENFKYEIKSKANELTDISFYIHNTALEV
ncbi:hypothetical protein CS063_13165 [Sporanaerobium hydrogeniformans]|uniref:Uncharacterized protein n=1 Tax=Sporanaerobium hydrogeniformans TaxID=3072179 RepID=A0AC61DA90_9FIRM|nr:sensor histidine kinase [Sporanaerobium hydrogeniformans]PHV69927.1 hypothetical protein CS063_13165 [Sporanaerobium hydrogeniformans]